MNKWLHAYAQTIIKIDNKNPLEKLYSEKCSTNPRPLTSIDVTKFKQG